MVRFKRRVVRMACLMAIVAMAVIAAPVAAARPIAFEVSIGSGCVYVDGPNSNPKLVLRAADGTIRDRLAPGSDACFAVPVNGGDRVKAVYPNTSRSFRVPNITPRIDRVTNIVTGAAPAGERVELLAVHSPGFRVDYEIATRNPRANGEGRYQTNFTAKLDLIGGDMVLATYSNGVDFVDSFATVPLMSVMIGDNTAQGSVQPGQNGTLVLRGPDKAVRARAYAGHSPFLGGSFSSAFYDTEGNAVYPRPGDRVVGSFASDAKMRVPDASVAGAASTDRVSGRCMANAPYALEVYRPSSGAYDVFYGISKSDGSFSKKTTARINLRAGDQLLLACRFATGDYVSVLGSAR